MMKLTRRLDDLKVGAALVLALALGTPHVAAQAATLYSQLPPGADQGLASDQTGSGHTADDFSLGAVTIDGIRFWGFADPVVDGPQSFSVRFFEDDGSGNNPQATPAHQIDGLLATGAATSFAQVFQYDLDLSATPVSLAPGKHYISLVNEEDTNFLWFWYTGDGLDANGLNWFRAGDGDAWTEDSSGLDLAFELFGTRTQLPEPDMLSLVLVTGLVGGLAIRHSRRR